MADDDAELVALIDNELDEASRSRLRGRLSADAALQARYDALRQGRADLTAAFDTLLERAPLDRLNAALPREEAPATTRRGLRGFALREFAAGLVVGLLAAGAAVWVALTFAGEDDWRAAVVNYMALYTNDTFAIPTPDRQTQAAELSAVGKKTGAGLTPDTVALPGLTYKVAFNLAYEGSPLGEVAYVDAAGKPLLFCVIANGAADSSVRTEIRDGFSLATWSRGGRGYLVIGRLPEQQAMQFAQLMETRL